MQHGRCYRKKDNCTIKVQQLYGVGGRDLCFTYCYIFYTLFNDKVRPTIERKNHGRGTI